MNVVTKNNISIVLIEKEKVIAGVQDILDVIVSAQYNYNCSRLILYKESFGDEFFNLKTGYAGEVLQKFFTYKIKVAIIGDFKEYMSKSFSDFIRECNQGNYIFFKSNLEEGLATLLTS